MYLAEVPVSDRVFLGVRVVSVIEKLSDATVLVAGIRPSCKHHYFNDINIQLNGNMQKIVSNLNTISAYCPSFP